MEHTEGCCKMKNLASALISAACEILNCFERYPEPHLKILKSIKGDDNENHSNLLNIHWFSAIYVIYQNLIVFSQFARYLADVGKMWGKSLAIPRKSITFVPRFPHHQ